MIPSGIEERLHAGLFAVSLDQPDINQHTRSCSQVKTSDYVDGLFVNNYGNKPISTEQLG